jgi:hypothetical protein
MRLSHPGSDIWILMAYIVGFIVVLAIMLIISVRTL